MTKDGVDVDSLTPQQKRVRTIRARRARDKRLGRSTSGKAGGATNTGTKGGSRKRGSKYGAKGSYLDDHYFPSQAEANRYLQLKQLQAAGQIDDLVLQPRYPIHIKNTKVCTYVADFKYSVIDDRGAVLREVIEDVKGMLTSMYRLKRKMVHASYPFTIVEIPGGDVVSKWNGRIPDPA